MIDNLITGIGFISIAIALILVGIQLAKLNSRVTDLEERE